MRISLSSFNLSLTQSLEKSTFLFNETLLKLVDWNWTLFRPSFLTTLLISLLTSYVYYQLSPIFTFGKKINNTNNWDTSLLSPLIREVLQRNVFLESEFVYIKLRPLHETNPGEMKPHTSLSSKISRFSRLHTGTRKCVGSTNKNSGKNGLKKMGFWRPDSLLSCSWTVDS